ncbi:Ig-like domain-containing protein [Methanobrevibacter sp. UBA212]|uniref:Ig-like domain-containing protein n=1 Tax=Methanobrevibacter sp. UBA212 TaxID=1915476 RepID=UPI0025E6F143|nr:Ig-like domain-containing protein [Methanobrevibacter sp. UBA212]
MRFKKYFLVICLIICLFTIASACASEVNDTEISAIDSDDNLEINEDNQVMDNDEGGLSDNASAKDDNGGIPAQQRDENSDSGRLGITDGDLIGDELNAKVVALNVTVADKPMFVVDCADKFNGNVAIRIGENKSIYDGGAKALIEADRLPAGNYVATALFYGDSNYENLTQNNIMFTVSRLTPTIDVNIEDVTYPNTAYANVHVGNYANGTVNVTVNNRIFRGVMSNGEANVALYGLPGGRMNAHIQFFSSDDYNDNVSSDDEFVVFPNNSLITIRCNEKSYVGEDIEIYIDTINSTGDLNIYINGVSYGYPVSSNPQKNYQVCISDKSEGTYQLDFRLDGDQNYTGYETSKTIDVIKRDLSINLEDIGESIYVDKPVTLKAKLSNTVKGNVIFTINGANYTEYVDNADVVTHEYTPVNNDILTVVATFEGNDMYNANVSDSRDFIVNRIVTTVDVEFPQSIIAGNDVAISVSMNPGITGVVTLFVDTKSYNVAVFEGSVNYYVTNLADGVYDVHAEFAGDDRYANSTSDVKQLFVNKVSTNLTISIDKVSMNYIEEAVVSIVLNQSINAVVTVKVNGNNHTVGLVNGKGSFTLYDLDKGNYIINAVFAGDDSYVGCTSNTLSLTVNGDNISSWVSISLNKPSVFAGDEVTITVNSNPTVTGIIKLNIGSNSYDVAVKRGVGKFTVLMMFGQYLRVIIII